MNIYPYKNQQPKIDPTAFIADTAVITGDVTIGAGANIWFGTVIRGDVAPVFIGENVNIQDNSVLHQSTGVPLIIENDVTIGHMCILHSCTIRKNALIGMGSTLLDGAEIGAGSFIGAGSLISPNKVIPADKMAYGRPAKVIRDVTEAEHIEMKQNIQSYVTKGQIYQQLQQSSPL